ncbi:hypothetical protein KL938_003015 [Ogataea parapolymorpha]|nr:hypothetical protein KL938_003015 [Ogataea parapolymorpha]
MTLLSSSDFLVQIVCHLHASVARLKLYVGKPRKSTALHVAKILACVTYCRWALTTRLEANATIPVPEIKILARAAA